MSPSTSPSTGTLPTRNIAKPTRRCIPPIDRSGIYDFNQSFESLGLAGQHRKLPINGNNAAAKSGFFVTKPTEEDEVEPDLNAAWSEFDNIQKLRSFEEEVKLRRDQFYGGLLELLDAITTCLHSKHSKDVAKSADPLMRLSPVKVAAAWEKKTWCAKYKTAYELNAYNEAMVKDITDLQIWIRYWGESSESEEMFREQFRQRFKDQVPELMLDEVASRSDTVSLRLSSIDVEQEETAPFAQLLASEMDIDFAEEPVVFGAAFGNE